MCIYYKNKSNLNYDSQEHIIPAAIGGKTKLPNDYVSREFNNGISKLEREFIQKSIIAMPREIEGPGKRGKLGEQHATTSEIFVLADSENSNLFALGYIKKGNGYEISQLVINTTTGLVEIRLDKIEQVIEFKEKCNHIDISRIKIIHDERLPVDILLLGIQEGIEKKFDFFFAKNEFNEVVLTSDQIKQIGEKINIDAQLVSKISYQPIFSRRVVFDINHFRVYGKIAFNYLSFKKGKDFVLHSQFDPVREWIANGGENNFASFANNEINSFSKVNIALPESHHLVCIFKVENVLMAKIFLYGALGVDIILCNNFISPFSLEALICDWKNLKEYELAEYIALFYKL